MKTRFQSLNVFSQFLGDYDPILVRDIGVISGGRDLERDLDCSWSGVEATEKDSEVDSTRAH